jgi:urease accessory protein
LSTQSNATYQPLAGLPLMVWLSPAFPVGAFAYSHALEWAAEAGRLPNATALEAWLGDLLAHGAPRNDCILLAASWRAMRAADHVGLAQINELALALAGSKERHLETSAQGTAFLIAIATSWPHPSIAALDWARDEKVAYPVAVGLVAAAHDQDGQRIVAALMAPIRQLGLEAADSTLDDLGSAAFISDIAAMRHETQTTRLFRT